MAARRQSPFGSRISRRPTICAVWGRIDDLAQRDEPIKQLQCRPRQQRGGFGTGLDRELPRRLPTARRVPAAQQCRVARHALAQDSDQRSERRRTGIRLRRKGLRVIKAQLSGTRPLRSDPPHRRNTIPHRARAVRAVLVAAAGRIVLAVVEGPAALAAVDIAQAVTAAARCAGARGTGGA